jgi:5-methylcytosine-specific restriction endonuclease McrA
MPTPATVTAKMIMELIERQEFRCALSGRLLTPETASLDHRIPLSRGGTHQLGNLWVVDHQVNAAKGSLTVDEFVAICREVTTRQAVCSQTEVA